MWKQFLTQVILTPRSIGAVVPSSRFLASRVVEVAQAGADEDTVFIELGPGTGAISRPLIRSRKGSQRVILIEKNSSFLNGLGELSGDFELVHACVSELESQVGGFGVRGNIVLVSSIPWLSLPSLDRKKAQDAIRSLMLRLERVRLVQYTYAPQSPLELDGVESKLVGKVLLNFPPAWIWVYEKKD